MRMSCADHTTLSAPDKYFLEVGKVHNMGPRLECMLSKNTFAKKAETINAVRLSLSLSRRDSTQPPLFTQPPLTTRP
jgi:hypothetical protein